ncbi:MAG: SpoIIE family protein phosphatase [Deltaproteobacteria bacterium]|nr:SpoIIE family protein phosphatase [Deltaproteobacteria bacterium]
MGGIPISVKLILATSIVVAAAVGTATWFGQKSIDDLTETSIQIRRETGERSIVRESELVVKAVATAVAFPLSTGTLADIPSLLDSTIREDKKTGENRVKWLVVTDAQGVVVGSTSGAPPKDKLDELERRLVDGIKNGDVVHAQSGEATDWVYGAPAKLGTSQVGSLRIGVSTAGLDKELQTSLSQAEDRAGAARNKMLLVSLVVLGIGVVLAALQGVRLAQPIKQLTFQAERIAAGDLQGRVPEDRGDELGVLARAFNKMADEIRHLLVEQAQKASLEKEMSLARQVQQAMLPPDTLDMHGHLKVVGYCMPASHCGGDWWTYIKLSNGRMLLVVGDATGHGIHSAMIAATARGAVEALSGIDERLLTPEQVLKAIDSAIRQVGEHNVLMTAFAALFDSTNGILHYANAGQNFPYVMKLGDTRLLEDASIIAASGNPLGDRNIPVEIRRGSLQLRPGDLFVCFTDGLVERANPTGKLFGDRRLRHALTGQPLPDGPALVHLRDRLVETLEVYAEGIPAEDDITLVLCQFDPPANRQSVPPANRQSVGRGAA